MRQQPPRTAADQHVKDRIQNQPTVVLERPATGMRVMDRLQRLDQHRLGVTRWG